MEIISEHYENDQFTQVLSGVQEGDLVVISSTTTAAPRVLGGMGLGGIAFPDGTGGGMPPMPT